MKPDNSLHEIAQFFSSELSKQQIAVNNNIPRKKLINILNYIDFQNETILINFKHLKSNYRLSIPAKPLPCFDQHLECQFVNNIAMYINKYELETVFLNYDDKFIMIKPELKALSETKVILDLPDIAWEVNYRENRRYQSTFVEAQVIQDGIMLHGELLDFSAVSFKVLIIPILPHHITLINKNSNVTIILKNKEYMIFSGECKIIRQENIGEQITFMLKPLAESIHRFKPKKYRSQRIKLTPSPKVTFTHPLTDRIIRLEAEDISGAGLSIKEHKHTSTLFPGLILPELKIQLGSYCLVTATAQVLYRLSLEENSKGLVKYGIAFIDMDIRDQAKLADALQRASNTKLHVCTNLDLESLWKLFFETGFIYPQKYAAIQNYKEKYKQLYAKLYLQPNDILRHFVYQEMGKIYGHISMVRFYQNTWLFHHHSARSSNLGRAGISVLRQIAQYANDFSSLHATHMNYIIAYFRPENKFPARIFGGFADQIGNRRACSVDEFAYLHINQSLPPLNTALDYLQHNGLELAPSTEQDLLQLLGFYDNSRSGLLLKALDLQPDSAAHREIDATYRKLGIRRERSVLSLTKNGDLHAIIMIAISDIGLNLSNLTNCLHVIVVDPDGLSADDLFHAIYTALHRSDYDDETEIPILIHPLNYVQREGIAYNKIYNLWVLNTFYGDDYFTFIESMLEKHKIRK